MTVTPKTGLTIFFDALCWHVTHPITSGTKLLTVASATGFSANEWISIAGVAGTFRIVSISGLVFTLSSNANAPVTGAAVAYVTPTFLNMATL